MPDDPLDYTDQYNTQLSPDQENAFQGWMQQQQQSTGRDLSKDLYDYDLRGDWLQGAARDERGHGTDVFKKPNHPTFSTGSQYHGVNGNQGGNWLKLDDGHWTFMPGQTNMQIFSADELKDYFQRVEPGNKLLLPQAN
jgi:hypothetical protein